MVILSYADIEQHLQSLQGWSLNSYDTGAHAHNAICKQFTFAGFPEAVAFVGHLVPEAEQADHHPDISINYKQVTLSYSTHSQGGVTLKDIEGARMADRKAHELL